MEPKLSILYFLKERTLGNRRGSNTIHMLFILCSFQAWRIYYPPCIQSTNLPYHSDFTTVNSAHFYSSLTNSPGWALKRSPGAEHSVEANLKAPSVSHHSLWHHWPPLFYYMVTWFVPRTPCAADAVRLRSSRAFYCYFLLHPHHSRWTSWYSSVLV